MRTTLLALAFVLFAAPAFPADRADSVFHPASMHSDIAQSDIQKGDEPYVVVQWMPADDEDFGRTGNAQHETEETRVD